MKKILRQELKSYTPEWNAKCSIITNLFILVPTLTLAIVLLIYSKKVFEIEINYTNCIPNQDNSQNMKTCKIQFLIPKKLKKPIFVYYRLKTFFINHRRIIESKSWKELKGEDVNTAMSCKGAYYMKEMFEENSPYYTNEWGHQFSEDDVASPCGLLAKCFFNDTYNITNVHGDFIYINETGISNKYLKTKFFKRRKNYKETQWIDVENEHFINWINMETFKNFKKLWGRIDTDMDPGNYYLIVHDNYDVSAYESRKSIIIGNENVFGMNNIIPYCFIVASAYLFLVILILWVKYVSSKDKKDFNISKLKWN